MLIGKQNRGFIRRLKISVNDALEDLLDHKEKSSLTNRRLYLRRVIDLLSHGHNLQDLILYFDDEVFFIAFMHQKTLTTALSQMRGVGTLSIEILDYKRDQTRRFLERRWLWCSVQELISKVQTQPAGELQSVSKEVTLHERAQKQAREMLALVNKRRDLLAGQRETEERLAHYQTMKDATEEKVMAIKKEVRAIDEELERLTSPATD